MRRRSLESKLCFLVVGLLFVLLLSVIRVQMTGQRAALIEEKIGRYQSLSKALAPANTSSAKTGRDSLYREFTARFMETDKDVTHIIISDAGGRALFADMRKPASQRYAGLRATEAGGPASLARWLGSTSDQKLETISIPTEVKPGERGTVTVGFELGSINAAAGEMRSRLLCTFAVALLIGLLGAALFARRMTSPLKHLITAARAVEAEDLDVSVDVSSNDEVGELADAFNRMVVALRENRAELIERANTDSLTGLYNHRYLQERLSSELKRAERYERSLSVVMLDIDHFKAVNDAHGHLVGDSVLKELAQVMTREVRVDIDVVARYGGEEFMLILPETSASDAATCAERLRRAVQRHCFMGEGDETIPVAISLGVAEYPVHSTEREGLIMAADLAMYQAKSLGGNKTATFSSDTRADGSADPYKLYLLLHAMDMSTIEAMAAAVDAKGHRHPGFSRAVEAHAVALAQETGLSEKEQSDIRIASLLHDIGKLGIPEGILNKKGPLTDEEREIIKGHPATGYAIVQKSPHLKSMLPGILHHHEWWDGNGYPDGLNGEAIPMIARMIAVVDAYHAMMTERPHAPARTPEDAKGELRRCAGAQFDPQVVDAFLHILEREAATDKAA